MNLYDLPDLVSVYRWEDFFIVPQSQFCKFPSHLEIRSFSALGSDHMERQELFNAFQHVDPMPPLRYRMRLPRINDQLAINLVINAASMKSNRLRQRYGFIRLTMQHEDRRVDIFHVPDGTGVARCGISGLRYGPTRTAGRELGLKDCKLGRPGEHIPIRDTAAANSGAEAKVGPSDCEIAQESSLRVSRDGHSVWIDDASLDTCTYHRDNVIVVFCAYASSAVGYEVLIVGS